jgi:hypothetical protein
MRVAASCFYGERCSSAFLSLACYHVNLPMKRPVNKISQRCGRVVTKLLLIGLLFSSGIVPAQYLPALGPHSEQPSTPESTSINLFVGLLRGDALTTSHGQRTAGDISRQNRIRHSVIHGHAAGNFTIPAAMLRARLVTNDQSVPYISFRSLRPGGRAPPVSA